MRLKKVALRERSYHLTGRGQCVLSSIVREETRTEATGMDEKVLPSLRTTTGSEPAGISEYYTYVQANGLYNQVEPIIGKDG